MKPYTAMISIAMTSIAVALSATDPIGEAAAATNQAVVIGSWCDSSVGQACDAAFSVDLATGQRALISAYTQEDFARDEAEAASNSVSPESRNRSGTGWNGVAVTPAGAIFVMAYQHQDTALWESLYRIDPASGDRQLLSPLSDASLGPVIGVGGTLFTRLVATPAGRLLAHHRLSDADPILAIDPDTGRRSLFSDPANSGQGPSFNYFLGLDPSGRMFATDTGNSNTESLMELDPDSGARTLVSQVPAQNPDPNPTTAFTCGSGSDTPEGGVKGAGNRLYCSDQFNSSGDRFSLDVVNTATGERSTLSDFDQAAQGPLVGIPRGQAWGPDGRLLLLDDGRSNTEGLGGIQAINPDTGTRTLLSDFGDATQGPQIFNARAFAVPPPSGSATPGTPDKTSEPGEPGKPVTVGGLNQSESADPVQANQPYSYAISFTNSGSTEATKVRLTDVLPKKSRLDSATASQGTCRGKGKIVCALGNVAAGSTVTVNISLTPRKAGTYRNKVQVTYRARAEGSKKMKLFKAISTESTSVTQ